VDDGAMTTTTKKPKIVIADGGFAGLSAAMYLDTRLARRADGEQG
jgi:predicted NAD/FAD-binding protein